MHPVAGVLPEHDVHEVLLRRGILAAFGSKEPLLFGVPEGGLALVDADRDRLLATVLVPLEDGWNDGHPVRPGRSAASLARAGDVLLLTTGTHLRAFDVTDAERPSPLLVIPMPGAYDVAASGARAVVLDGGVVVLDLADPRQAHLAARVDTPGTPMDAFCRDELVLVADGAAGLTILQARERDTAAE